MNNTVYFARTDAADLSAAARELLARALGKPAELVMNAHGKPELAEGGVYISLTHTRGAVACALSDAPVGVDIERPRAVNPKLSARFFSAREAAYADTAARFLEVWTRKEAYLKRDGCGIAGMLRTLDLLEHPEISTRMAGDYTLSFCGESGTFELVEIPL